MERVSVDSLVDRIGQQLHLSKQTEYELLSEIRTHLEEAVSRAQARGEDEQTALLRAAEQFGVEEVGAALQEVHAGWETVEALAAAGLPVLLAVILRWLAFAPGGSAFGWPQLLSRPVLWGVAAAALILPVLHLRRWRIALVAWAFFWLLSVIFVLYPNQFKW